MRILEPILPSLLPAIQQGAIAYFRGDNCSPVLRTFAFFQIMPRVLVGQKSISQPARCEIEHHTLVSVDSSLGKQL